MPTVKKKVNIPKETKKRQPGYFKIIIGEKVISPLTKEEFLDKYFVNLDKNLKKDTDLDKLIKQYELVWRKKGKIQYIDSWGHKWDQGVSYKVQLEYLKSKQDEITE